MATATVKTLLERLADDFGLGRYGTASAGSTTSITDDTHLGGPEGAREIDVGCAAYITYDAGGSSAAPEDEETRLSSKPKLSTGVVNLDPALTQAIAASDQFMVAYKPITFKVGSGPYSIFARLNEALRAFAWEKRIVPVTLVPDGDMLATGTTSWSETGDGAISKVAATFPLGERVLRMTGVTANDYILSGTIAVEEQKSYYLEVTGMIASTGAAADQGTLVLYDETNGANITLNETTIDRFEPERLVNNVTMPSDCEQVSVRMEADNAGDIIDWANVIFRKNEAREFVVADRPQKVMRLGRLLAPTSDDWATRGSWREVPAELEQLDAGLWRYRALESVSNMSLWYEEFVTPASLSTAAGTTTIPIEHLAAVVAELLLRPLRFTSKVMAAKYDYAKDRSAGVLDAYHSQNETVVTRAPSAYPLVRV